MKHERSDAELDRMLTDGQPAGPELDRVWEQIAPQVVAQQPKRSWAGWLAWSIVPAAVAATAALIWFDTPDFAARGATGAVRLEATCGAADDPCSVGQPVLLRVIAPPASGSAWVFLIQGEAPRLVSGPVALSDSETYSLPVTLTPEPTDVMRGITLRAYWTDEDAASVDPQELAARPPDSTLRLQVVP